MKRARLGFVAVAVGLGMSLFAMQGIAEARCRRCRVRWCRPVCCYHTCCPAPSCCGTSGYGYGCSCLPGAAPQVYGSRVPSGTADLQRVGGAATVDAVVPAETVITAPPPKVAP